MIKILGSRKVTILVFLLLLAALTLEGWSGKLSGPALLALGSPLAVNLIACLWRHLRRGGGRRAERAGFLLFHAALLVIMAGGAISYRSYSVGYVELMEGESFVDRRESYHGWREHVGGRRGTGVRVQLERIRLDFWDNGQIREYYNDVTIHDGARVRMARVNVNRSVRHGPLLINLARFYGPAPVFTLTAGGESRRGSVNIGSETRSNAFTIPLLQYPARVSYRDLAEREMHLQVFPPEGPPLEKTMRPGDVLDLGGGRLELTEVKIWNGITVVTDAGRWISYAGFALFLTGLALFYTAKFRDGN